MADNTEQDERTNVLRQYAFATEHYAWTVCELERQRGKLPKHEYDQLYLAVEQARVDAAVELDRKLLTLAQLLPR